jgi:ABC-type uncharacterized transport system ATPase subunit
VAENVVLGREPRLAGLLLDSRRALREAAATIEGNGFGLDPARMADTLSVGERQQLEIVKLLHGKAEILVLDEPTSLLTEQEARSLFATLRRLRDAGKTVILITHKLREVKEISDTVTVMRRGRTIRSLPASSVDEAELACLVMGTASCASFARRSGPERGAVVFEMRGVGLRSRAKAPPLLDSISLAVAGGEVLGLCGVAGNGLSEIEDMASGLARPSSGEVLLHGRPLPRTRGPGLGYVPSDRMRRGACLEASVGENLAALDRASFFPGGLADLGAQARFAERAIGRFSIAARPRTRMGSLSGGNIQKAILARELAQVASGGLPPFLLFSDPTWGLDVAGTEFVYERIIEARDSGAAVLLISSNLDELLALADRVSVMYKGRAVCDLLNDGSLSRERLGEYMLGLRGAPDGR